jgi:hypothetical protein
MEINLKHPLKKLGKNDQTAGVQVDRPALQITVNKSKRPCLNYIVTNFKIFFDSGS